MNQILYILIHCTFYVIILYLDKLSDLALIENKLNINHTRGGIIRLSALLLNVLVLKFIFPISWELSFKILFLECAIWWIVFDIYLNIANKQTPFHVGGAWIDKQFLKLNYGDYWIILVKGFILGIAVIQFYI